MEIEGSCQVQRVGWDYNLINKDIYYISLFLSSDRCRSLFTYNKFCIRWGLRDYKISQNNYSIIRMAIRDFCRVVGLNNDYKCIEY